MASSPLLRKSHSDRCAKRDPRARRVRRMIKRADMQIFRQIVPPMRRSRSDRCARRDPRARRGSPMIRRADMRVGQTVPPLRRSHSDRCAKRDPRARRGRPMISRADMRIFRQTVPPLRRSHSDRCAQRDPRARRARQRTSRAAMQLPHPGDNEWWWHPHDTLPQSRQALRGNTRWRFAIGVDQEAAAADGAVRVSVARRLPRSSVIAQRHSRGDATCVVFQP